MERPTFFLEGGPFGPIHRSRLSVCIRHPSSDTASLFLCTYPIVRVALALAVMSKKIDVTSVHVDRRFVGNPKVLPLDLSLEISQGFKRARNLDHLYRTRPYGDVG